MEVKDKVIIITGASAGIGLEAAKLFTEKEAKVVLAARSEKKLKELEQQLPGSFAVTTDMTKPEDIDNLIQKTKEHYGRIDILINNAGQGIYGAIENVKADAYRDILELNVIGPLIAMQKVIPIMRAQGSGMIINISSMVSKAYIPRLGAYASSKYALNCLSHTARAELAGDNIIVSTVYPGLTETDFGKNAIKSDEAAKGMVSRKRPDMPDPDTPGHVAKRILYAIESGKPEVLMKDN